MDWKKDLTGRFLLARGFPGDASAVANVASIQLQQACQHNTEMSTFSAPLPRL